MHLITISCSLVVSTKDYSFTNLLAGIEAEAVMLGQAISMVLPPVIGYKIYGELSPLATSTDIVLTITKVNASSYVPSAHSTVYISMLPSLNIVG